MIYKPPIDSLTKTPEINDTNEQEEVVIKLNNFFKEHKVKAEVRGFELGPVVTKYHVYLLEKGKYIEVKRRYLELVLLLGNTVLITSPIAGEHYFDIEAVNKNIKTTPLSYFLNSREMAEKESKWIIPIGVMSNSNIITFDIRDTAHFLVAGMKNSGMYEFMHSSILSLILRNSPKELKFILIGSKNTSLDLYKNIPYLSKPVIKKTLEVKKVFEEAVDEVDKRAKLIESSRVNTLDQYNDVNKEGMERIVIVIEDLSKIYTAAPDYFVSSIQKFLFLGRNVGVHLFTYVSEPTTKLFRGFLQAFTTETIAFKLKDSKTSNMLLYRPGAEKLVGKGDLIFSTYLPYREKRLQAPYVSKEDIKKIVEAIVV